MAYHPSGVHERHYLELLENGELILVLLAIDDQLAVGPVSGMFIPTQMRFGVKWAS